MNVDVIYCRTELLTGDAIDAAVRVLSDDEQQRHARFAFDRDRRDFAIAHALLRHLISAAAGGEPRDWRFVVDAGGKPKLADNQMPGVPLSFNITHTHGLVACAIARGVEVGVDVERIDRAGAWLDLAQRFFSAAEVAQLEEVGSSELAERFIEIWTLKEAYVKALGHGLATPLDAFSFLFEDAHGLRLQTRPPLDAAGLFALYAPMPACRIAVAVPGLQARSIRLYESLDGTAALNEVATSPLRQTHRG